MVDFAPRLAELELKGHPLTLRGLLEEAVGEHPKVGRVQSPRRRPEADGGFHTLHF